MNIKAIRKEKGLSIRGLAKITGLNPSSISRIEQGTTSPSPKTLLKIKTALAHTGNPRLEILTKLLSDILDGAYAAGGDTKEQEIFTMLYKFFMSSPYLKVKKEA